MSESGQQYPSADTFVEWGREQAVALSVPRRDDD